MGKKRMKHDDKGNYSFFGVDTHPVPAFLVQRHILTIIIITILTNATILIVTPGIFHSFVDLFDISIYFQYAMNIVNGQIPYVDFSIEYPVLFLIPLCIPIVGVLVTQDPFTYVTVFQIFMTVVDILIAILVYFIALRTYKNQNALYAGILSASAFSSLYFTMTKYDAFPTLFLVAAIFFTISGCKGYDYITSVLGFLTKVFPALVIPYQIIYNWKRGSRIAEIKRFLLYAVIPVAIFIIPVALVCPGIFYPFFFATGANRPVCEYCHIHLLRHFA